MESFSLKNKDASILANLARISKNMSISGCGCSPITYIFDKEFGHIVK